MLFELVSPKLNFFLVFKILQLLLPKVSLFRCYAFLLLLLLDVVRLGLAAALLLNLLSGLSGPTQSTSSGIFLFLLAFAPFIFYFYKIAILVKHWRLFDGLRSLGTFDKDLSIDLFESENGFAGASSSLIGCFEKAVTCRLHMREADGTGILLGAATATTRIYVDQGLSIRPLGMFVLHVSIKGRV